MNAGQRPSRKKIVQKSLTENKFRGQRFTCNGQVFFFFRNKSLILLFPVAPEFHKVRVSKLFTTEEDYSHDLPIWVLELPRG